MEKFNKGDSVVFCTLEELKERFPEGISSSDGFNSLSGDMWFVNLRMIEDFAGEVFTVLSDESTNGMSICIAKDSLYPHKNLTTFDSWSFSRGMFKIFEGEARKIPDGFSPDFSILFS